MTEFSLGIELLWLLYGEILSKLGQIMTVTLMSWSVLHLMGRLGKRSDTNT